MRIAPKPIQCISKNKNGLVVYIDLPNMCAKHVQSVFNAPVKCVELMHQSFVSPAPPGPGIAGT